MPAPRFRIVTPAEWLRMPWRNARGTTLEVATDADAPGAPWSWRLSIADVPGPSAFSAFPGIDRHLARLEGRGLRVRLGDPGVWQDVPDACAPGTALAFRGEDAAFGEPVGAGVRDVNLFAVRARWHGALRTVAGGSALAPAGVALLHLPASATEAATVHTGERTLRLAPGETLVAERAGPIRTGAGPCLLAATLDDARPDAGGASR